MENKQDDKSSYSFNATVNAGKLELELLYGGSNNKYVGSYDAEQLRTCGFPSSLCTDPHAASKYLMAAKYGVEGIQFLIEFVEKGEKTASISVFQNVGSIRILDIKLNMAQIPRDRWEIVEEQLKHLKTGNQQLNLQVKGQADTLKGVKQENKTLTERVNTMNQKLIKSDEIIFRLTTDLALMTQQFQDVKSENSGLMNTFRQHAMPKGSIIIWSGSVDNTPKGWQLCNGRDGAPDLRNRFIIGAGGQLAPNEQGGSDKHEHKMNKEEWWTGQSSGPYTTVGKNIYCGEEKHLPPYYALCFIVKII